MKTGVLILILLSASAAEVIHGQKNTGKILISGYVVDADKKPVSGAMIFVDKQNTGKTTDINGSFRVKVKPDAGRITVFTYTSGSAEEIIGGRTTLFFILSGSSRSHDTGSPSLSGNEPVNIGYGARKNKDLTLPVNQIDATGTDYSAYSDIYDILNGAVPGVQVSGRKIVIRGVATNSTNTDPLFLVNGVTVPSIDNIQPSMVESIQVLKGAAASMYGVQGANGVIMITLKSAGK